MSSIRDILQTLKQETGRLAYWPLITRLAALGLLLLYLPVLWQVTWQSWLHDDTYSHGLLVLPTSFVLLWLQRERLRAAAYAPDGRGLWGLLLGLLMLAAAWLLHAKFLMIASLPATLAGAVLALHGRELLRECRFAIGFLLFAAPIPGPILNIPGARIQRWSSIGAAHLMEFLGYPVHRSGNIIDVPGMPLEVAQACSGFKKLFALIAFAVLYGYLYDLSLIRRLILVGATLPIALFANVLRIAALGIIASSGGPRAEAAAHDPAELCVVILSCLLFIGLGRLLGCDQTRFAKEEPTPSVPSVPETGRSRSAPNTGVLTCALLVGAMGINLAMANMPQIRPVKLPVQIFPTQIADWHSIKELAETEMVRKKLPTATLVERFYVDRLGRQVFLRLVTASDYGDFHDPNLCIPGQGFTIESERDVLIQQGRQHANQMLISDKHTKMNVLYWLPGDQKSTSYLGTRMPVIETVRRALTGEQGGSLVVFLSQPDDELGGVAIHDFAEQIRAPLEAILAAGKKSNRP